MEGDRGEAEASCERSFRSATSLRLETQYKKLHFQYNLYQECGFLYLISGCMLTLGQVRYRPSRSASTDVAYGDTESWR
eukprot:2706734-Rhodomonas_salina.2